MPSLTHARPARCATIGSTTLCALLFLLALARGSVHPAAAQPLSTPVPAASSRFPLSDPHNAGGWVPVDAFTDDFKGDTLDLRRWHPAITGWRGRPPAPFSPANVSVSGGMLHIQLRRQAVDPAQAKLGFHDYTTGAVQSTASLLYGYVEVRARAMASAGSSAIWLAANQAGNTNEIDIAEMAGRAPANPHQVFMSLHVFQIAGAPASFHNRGVTSTDFNPSEGFHIYAVDWGPQFIDFYLDGRLKRRIANDRWFTPATLILDAEIQPNWFGLPADTDLPSTYTIDYVHTWQHRSR